MRSKEPSVVRLKMNNFRLHGMNNILLKFFLKKKGKKKEHRVSFEASKIIIKVIKAMIGKLRKK